ncbi:MAG: C-type lectin domain-containing protein [Anaerolineae bacterium]|nr:C-type lectin domain-containing protein [Anaerolineae bacterium]
MKRYGVVAVILLILIIMAAGPLASTGSTEGIWAIPVEAIPGPTGHRYLPVDDSMVWHDAVSYCTTLNGHLVTIDSMEENEFVYNLLPYSWLGATDEAAEGNWEWVTGEPWAFNPWAPGEPNNCCPPDICGGTECTPEHYLTFWGHQHGSDWNDVPGFNHKPFVCEWNGVPVDIKPASCPNPLNYKSRGVLPVAILGTAEIDVTQIDPASVRLEGVAPLRWATEDVATPFYPYAGKEDCHLDCNTAGEDGCLDLTLKFDTQEVVDAIAPVSRRECRVLHLTASHIDGESVAGEDVVLILK